ALPPRSKPASADSSQRQSQNQGIILANVHRPAGQSASQLRFEACERRARKVVRRCPRAALLARVRFHRLQLRGATVECGRSAAPGRSNSTKLSPDSVKPKTPPAGNALAKLRERLTASREADCATLRADKEAALRGDADSLSAASKHATRNSKPTGSATRRFGDKTSPSRICRRRPRKAAGAEDWAATIAGQQQQQQTRLRRLEFPPLRFPRVNSPAPAAAAPPPPPPPPPHHRRRHRLRVRAVRRLRPLRRLRPGVPGRAGFSGEISAGAEESFANVELDSKYLPIARSRIDLDDLEDKFKASRRGGHRIRRKRRRIGRESMTASSTRLAAAVKNGTTDTAESRQVPQSGGAALDEEVQAYRRHQFDEGNRVEDLSEQDQLLARLCRVPRLERRLKALQFIGQFAENLAAVEPPLLTIIAACSSLEKANTYGFRLASLTTLQDVKSADKRWTMLQYIVNLIDTKMPELSDFDVELKHCEKAATVNLDNLRALADEEAASNEEDSPICNA
uniref:FH2 domain-containing protein n=1 Tax=Macrostomum lignano TaxID=282301 RepID=A0A1I8F457_9PLAT